MAHLFAPYEHLPVTFDRQVGSRGGSSEALLKSRVSRRGKPKVTLFGCKGAPFGSRSRLLQIGHVEREKTAKTSGRIALLLSYEPKRAGVIISF